MMWLKLFCIYTLHVMCLSAKKFISVKGRNFMLGGEKVFLSGINQAWVNYGEDFGNRKYNESKNTLVRTLDFIRNSGGNSLRIWLHVDGSNTPEFDHSGMVTGIDRFLVDDLGDFLEEAQRRNILVTLVLWNCAVNTGFRLRGLLTSGRKLQSYITRALRPMVRALRNRQALFSWEIINEPEGCLSLKVRKDIEPCFDTRTLVPLYDRFGWTGEHLRMETLLRFISRQADAIHKADGEALVTVGTSSHRTVTDEFSLRNFYTDDCLKKAGGVEEGYLDFYQIHTYDFLGTYLYPHSPFKTNGALYGLSKPLIIGEFSERKGAKWNTTDQHHWAYEQNYNGVWAWSFKGDDEASDDMATLRRGLLSLKDKDRQSEGGRVNISIALMNPLEWICHRLRKICSCLRKMEIGSTVSSINSFLDYFFFCLKDQTSGTR